MEDGNYPGDCEVCSSSFDHERRPRSLPCGHSFCSTCVSNLFRDWSVVCPGCREKHYAKDRNQFPVNYGLEALLRKLNTFQTCSESNQTGLPSVFGESELSAGDLKPRRKELRGIEKLEMLVQEQIRRVQRLPSAYSGMIDMIGKYKTQVLVLQNDHKQQKNRLEADEERFHDLIQENKVMLSVLKERYECLSALSRECKEKCRDLASAVESLTSTPTPGDMAQDIAEADLCIGVKDAIFKKCHGVILDGELVRASKELLARTRDVLQQQTTTATLTDDSSRHFDHSSSIKVEDLLEMTGEVQSLLRNNLVFALQHREGHPRFAKITSEGNNELYLHHLQDTSPPEDAHVLPYNEVYRLVDASSTLAFLDVGWNQATQGRVRVRLHPDTARARQFSLLCTGLLGPTYANTRLLAVGNRGSPLEYVRGGDYQYNNGTGGAALLPGLRRGGEYWRQQVEGSVMAAGSWGDPCSAQFIVNTKNPGSSQWDDTIYGRVEGGLHVLQAAVKNAKIADVNVTDCGIVISL